MNHLRQGAICHQGDQCPYEHINYQSPLTDLRCLNTFIESHQDINWMNGIPSCLCQPYTHLAATTGSHSPMSSTPTTPAPNQICSRFTLCSTLHHPIQCMKGTKTPAPLVNTCTRQSLHQQLHSIPEHTQLHNQQPTCKPRPPILPIPSPASPIAELTRKLRHLVLELREFDPKLIDIVLCQLELFSLYYHS